MLFLVAFWDDLTLFMSQAADVIADAECQHLDTERLRSETPLNGNPMLPHQMQEAACKL